MKKLLVLMLVLGMASLANAAIVYTYSSDSAGSTVITETLTGSTFYLVISGLTSDMPTETLKLYDAYENVGAGSDYADFTGTGTFVDNGQGEEAAGNASGLTYSATYDGWDAWAVELVPVAPEGAVSGKWFILQLLAGSTETTGWTVTLYQSDYWTPTGSTTGGIDIVPEPMTLALLGIGGLFLRRRKA